LNDSETQHFLIIELGFVPQPNLQITFDRFFAHDCFTWERYDPETGFVKQTRFLKPLSFLNKKLGVRFYHRLLTYLNPPALKIL